jgi:CheY-like chemotaxis protein
MPAEPQWVLLVEDDQSIRDALSELLRDEGFSVATAANGVEALSWLRAERPKSCVVLLDLMMPVMDGSEFLRVKRADATLTRVPVLILTAAGASVQIDQMADIKGRISKPIELPDLMAALASCGDPPSRSGREAGATTAVAAASPPSRFTASRRSWATAGCRSPSGTRT